jgi:hypothetical protein
MTCSLRYHKNVRHWILASVSLLAVLLLPGLSISHARAQINGVPASVTSPGFGGRAINGTPASVTSLGPRGFAPHGGGQFRSIPRNDRDHGGDHHRDSQFVYPFYYPYYGSGYGDSPDSYGMDSPPDAESDSDYQGGPTIFDRRGRGAEDYVPPVKDTAPPQSSQAAPSSEPPAPETPQVPTVLVFKDGHQSEVENYAIFGQTLFDLTPGHRRKIALADLDLVATEKQNDDRGVTFQLPPGTQAN